MDVSCRLQVEATLVANEFIDQYMADANGEYVKVYLYLLRHQSEQTDMAQIADALNHTEADVKRALLYWQKMGVLHLQGLDSQTQASSQTQRIAPTQVAAQVPVSMRTAPEVSVPSKETPTPAPISRLEEYDPGRTGRLQGDADFSQLLYIAQRYLSKVFTQRELEVFAYLYDGLHMSAELLEYLVEYCVQNGHNSLRYIETVALNWHEKGIQTVEAAKAYSAGFTKDSFAVMRAFGLTDRKPGDAEKELIEKWFKSYGFTREIVLEACNRTMEATHNPSFRYADKILAEWSKAGVKNLGDVSALDEKRIKKSGRRPGVTGKTTNQFHNFEQRDTNYDSLVMNQVKDWIGES